MKKLLIALSIALLALQACDKAEPELPVDISGKFVENGQGKSPAECRDYIQQTCIEAVELIRADDVNEVGGFVQDLVATVKNSDLMSLLPFAGRVLEAFLNETTGDMLISLAPCTGHFTLIDNRWEYEPADDLWFRLDVNGESCLVSLLTSGETFSANLVRNSDNRLISAELPENITVKVDKGTAADYLRADLNLKLATKDNNVLVANGVPDWETICASSLFASIKLSAKDYTLDVKQLSLEGRKLAAEVCLAKGGTSIVTLSAKVDGVNVVQDGGAITALADKATVDVDLLSKLQVSGYVFVNQLERDLSAAAKNNADEKLFKESVAAVNGDFDLGMFFDGQLQARVVDGAVDDGGIWNHSLLLRFNDGSSTEYDFEDYFSAESFPNLVLKVQRLIESINI